MVAGEVGGGVVEVVRLAVCPLAPLGVYPGLQFIPVLCRVAGRVEAGQVAVPLVLAVMLDVLPGQQVRDGDLRPSALAADAGDGSDKVGALDGRGVVRDRKSTRL